MEEEKEWEEFDAEAEEAEEEEAEEGPGPNWQCKECTFINEVAEVLECGMCGATWTPPSEAEPGRTCAHYLFCFATASSFLSAT